MARFAWLRRWNLNPTRTPSFEAAVRPRRPGLESLEDRAAPGDLSGFGLPTLLGFPLPTLAPLNSAPAPALLAQPPAALPVQAASILPGTLTPIGPLPMPPLPPEMPATPVVPPVNTPPGGSITIAPFLPATNSPSSPNLPTSGQTTTTGGNSTQLPVPSPGGTITPPSVPPGSGTTTTPPPAPLPGGTTTTPPPGESTPPPGPDNPPPGDDDDDGGGGGYGDIWLGSQHLLDFYHYVSGIGGENEEEPPQPASYDFFRFDDEGRVMIAARANSAADYASFGPNLVAVGMDILNVEPSAWMVTGYLPPISLGALPGIPGFETASPVFKPVLRTGSVTSEGDMVMGAAAFRSSLGVTGAGIGVGVLSDSTDQFAGGLADSVATGDLPPNVNVISDGSPGDSDEGRAMLEIVHDIAPGSPLSFYTAFGGPTDFANGIRTLYNQGARVITDDVGYANSPQFSSGRMGQAVADVVNGGAVYTSAAGNSADDGWRAPWAPLTTTVGNVTGDFQTFAANSALQTFTLPANDSVTITFSWSEAYLEGGDPSANFQVDADFAAYVVNPANGNILATQDDDNPNTDEAWEFLTYTNNSGTTDLAFAFRLKSGPAPARLSWILWNGPDINALGGGGPTIFGQPLSPFAIATGAADVATPTVPESFTSFGGPLELYADETGAPLAPLVVQKPDVTGPDGGINTFFGDNSSGDFRFFGTSAAAPHVAGAAALLMEQSGASGIEISNHLRQTAIDIGAPGTDPLTGTGMVQLTPFTGGGGGIGPLLPPDIFENNDTSEVATNLGNATVLGATYLNLTSSDKPDTGLPDYDWYRLNAASSGTFRVTAQGTGEGLTLEVHLFTFSGNFLTEVAAVSFDPDTPGTVNWPVFPGDTMFIEVKGASTGVGGWMRGGYNMTINIV